MRTAAASALHPAASVRVKRQAGKCEQPTKAAPRSSAPARSTAAPKSPHKACRTPFHSVSPPAIGPGVLLTNSIVRIKEPSSAADYGWHQDADRIQVEPGFVLAFIAISDATLENGCLRVIPGSQREVRPFSLVGFADRQVAPVREVDERGVVDMVLARGQVSRLHCNTIHGWGPNRSSGRHIGLINDYTIGVGTQVGGGCSDARTFREQLS